MSAATIIGARLRKLREEPRDQHGRAHRSREKWALMMRSAAGDDADDLPGVKSLADMIKQWERGDNIPGPIYRPLYAKVTGKPEAELFAEAPDRQARKTSDGPLQGRRDALKLGVAAVAPEVLHRVLRGTAAEAMEFTRLAGATSVGAGTFAHLDAVITEIDRAYSRDTPADLFAMTRSYRHRVADLIQGPHTLKQARELYVYAAWLSEALAWLAHDLGDPFAAESWAVDSYEHADQAGHDELCAWATDAMASIAIYTDRPDRALAAARQGIARAPQTHPLAVRLRAQAARAHARLGDREECEDMLHEAGEVYGRLPARAPLRFTVDTGNLAALAMTSYPASAYIWLGDADRGDFAKARTHAQAAIDEQQALPDSARSPSREAIARVDLGIALAALGEPEEAAAMGRRALASPRLVDSVRSRAGDLDRALAARHPEVPAVRDFHEMYRHVQPAR
ncbi:tetratricopeptide repeat protein [Actinomadura decatromicini]|uniref:Tetratricopeptide repeat protein n=1 Tax=Actinomadura decatromicini TaxID=2604572 RepID=A0A5D3FGN6_9ACTN|nr:tetratricopeptide repeat protein [Actinomadura decatromicini]TYK47142.1 tetratricopeptide repeat protein [Actinomadura decatromicini]